MGVLRNLLRPTTTASQKFNHASIKYHPTGNGTFSADVWDLYRRLYYSANQCQNIYKRSIFHRVQITTDIISGRVEEIMHECPANSAAKKYFKTCGIFGLRRRNRGEMWWLIPEFKGVTRQNISFACVLWMLCGIINTSANIPWNIHKSSVSCRGLTEVPFLVITKFQSQSINHVAQPEKMLLMEDYKYT